MRFNLYILLIFLCFFSIITIPNSEAVIYIDEEYGFWIEYPDNWHKEDIRIEGAPIPGINSGAIIFPTFRDGVNWWEHFVSVTLYKNHTATVNFQQDEFFENLEQDLDQACKFASFDFEGHQCSNHKILNSIVIEINNMTAYQITDIWTENYPDGTNSTKVGVITDIIIENDLWQIDSIIIESLYEENTDRINEIVGSFKFLEEHEVRGHFQKANIPDWVRNNADWWSDGIISDTEFTQGLQYLINEKIIIVPKTTLENTSQTNEIPSWVKKSAGWWADGLVGDDSFIEGIQYMIKEGIIKLV